MIDRPTSQFVRLLQHDFYGFVHRSFLELSPSEQFLPNWHVELMASKLEDVRLGRTRRLILNVPPRHLKSHLASISFVAWMLGHSPASRLLCVSYGQELADKLARDCRRLMASAFYRALFRTRLSEDRQAIADFETTAGGGRFSTSVGGVMTGRGGDIIMIDDPMKADDAYSEVRRSSVNEWYDNTLYSRLNNKETGAIVLIMQRLHASDLVAHVMKQEQWEVVSFPAIAPESQDYEFSTPFGIRRLRRARDEVLHPARESLSTLNGIRQTMREAKFQAQYQQTPMPPAGIYVKPAWFKTFTAPPANPDMILQSWDTASKTDEIHDFSVCTTWAILDRHAYLLDVFRDRLEFPALRRKVEELARRHGADTVLIEDTVSGTALIQQLREDGLSSASAVTITGDKEMRFMAQTAKIESGFVHLPRDAPWRDAYMSELTSFPNGNHDDQVDSTTNALKWLSDLGETPGLGLLRYYQTLSATDGEPEKPRLVRMKLPPSRTYQFPVAPWQINVGEDGIVEVSEEVEEWLRRAGGVRLE